MEFQIWKTIELGAHKDVDAYRSSLFKGQFGRDDWTDDITNQKAFTVRAQPEAVALVLMTMTELGLPDGAILTDINEAGVSMGLSLCPAEVGLALRLAYSDQPRGERMFIAMEPIEDSDGVPRIFEVSRSREDQGKGIIKYIGINGTVHTWRASADQFFGRNNSWVFVTKASQ